MDLSLAPHPGLPVPRTAPRGNRIGQGGVRGPVEQPGVGGPILTTASWNTYQGSDDL